MIKNWWCDATWEMRNKCVSHNITIIGLTICFFMLHNPYKSKKWYLSMHRLARSLTNQSCGPLLIWNGPLQIWNGTLFSKMAPWCGQVRGHSLFDKKIFPIPVLSKIKENQYCLPLSPVWIVTHIALSLWLVLVFSCLWFR
jgi:hypothetical protein